TSTNQGEFKVRDKVTITPPHIPRIKPPQPTLKPPYKTYPYLLTYKPTNPNQKLNNHKSLVNQHIKHAPKDPFTKGHTVK
ncbi:DUF1541 domain-containing protein, partial [Staphylococcus hominis]|uniref:DUF1541 domain-containing protein n=1 Tax=Staphylococcus hominis TaxID=1290 RepID=UPI00119E3AE2